MEREMQQEGAGHRQPEYPTENEDELRLLAWLSAICGLVGSVAVGIWIFSFNERGEWESLSRSVLPFMTVAAAVITFLTVMYRGAVTARQADEQRRQNDEQQIQNKRAARSDTSLLLDSGVKLMSQPDRSSLSLGISFLTQVVGSPDHDLAEIAARQLHAQIGPVAMHTNKADRDALWEELLSALKTIKSQGLDGPFFVTHTANAGQRVKFSDRLPNGHYSSFGFEFASGRESTPAAPGYTFSQCELSDFNRGSGGRIIIDDRFRNCAIHDCAIHSVATTGLDGAALANVLHDCDLTGTRFETPDDLISTKIRDCRYRKDSPPYIEGKSWGEFCETGDLITSPIDADSMKVSNRRKPRKTTGL